MAKDSTLWWNISCRYRMASLGLTAPSITSNWYLRSWWTRYRMTAASAKTAEERVSGSGGQALRRNKARSSRAPRAHQIAAAAGLAMQAGENPGAGEGAGGQAALAGVAFQPGQLGRAEAVDESWSS